MKFCIFALVLALAAPAAAQNAGAASSPSKASKTPDPDRLICERQEETGTRLGGKKVCKTAATWADERREDRENTERIQRQGTNPGNPPG